MFTGIIEATGRVAALEPRGDLTRLVLEAPDVVEGVEVGDSIAVSGACLTVVAVEGDRISFDCVQETLDRTSLGDQEVGSRLNLELALRAGGRLDGHIVQGHVDGTGTVRAFEREGEDVRLYVDCGPEVTDFLVEKGSVAINVTDQLAAAAIADGAAVTGGSDLTLSATGSHENTTVAKGGAGDNGSGGATSVGGAIAITVADHKTDASIGTGSAMSVTGDLNATATHHGSTTTTADGTATGGTAVGVSLALAFVDDIKP